MKYLAVLSAILAVTVADDDPAYYCDSDSYCEKKYPGTVCISVNNNGDVISKCTPDTAKRPACRGANPGLCPSYQSPDIGYLNAHCVFVSVDNLSLSSSGSGSSRRLMADATNSSSTTASTAGSSTSAGANSSTTETTSNSRAGSDSEDTTTTVSGNGAKSTFTVTISGVEVKGQFVCLDVSECASKAADPSTCEPSTCQSPNSKEVCTYHGSCTYKNRKKITKRSCMCYAGYEGDKCEKEVSNACDVDCGTGGDCVDGKCVCKKGFDGKKYDGKQGKPSQRCTRCTNDLACQNDNTCNINTGKCICGPGYSGDTCGATEDSCTTRTDCGIGACQVLANGSSACYCPECSPTCKMCDMTGNFSFDCSTCPTDSATSAHYSKMLALLSMFIAVILTNLVL